MSWSFGALDSSGVGVFGTGGGIVFDIAFKYVNYSGLSKGVATTRFCESHSCPENFSNRCERRYSGIAGC